MCKRMRAGSPPRSLAYCRAGVPDQPARQSGVSYTFPAIAVR